MIHPNTLVSPNIPLASNIILLLFLKTLDHHIFVTSTDEWTHKFSWNGRTSLKECIPGSMEICWAIFFVSL